MSDHIPQNHYAMKKNLLFISLALIAISTAIFSCKKTSVEEHLPPATPKEVLAIKSWLTNQQAISTNGAWVREMIATIDWGKSEKVPFRDGEVLITFPVAIEIQNTVNSKYLTRTNSSTRNVLALILDREGSVQQGSISQLTPTQSTFETGTAMLVSNIYNKTSIQFTGSFSQFTVDNHFLYELQFKNNRQSGETKLKYLPKSDALAVIVNNKRLDQATRKALTSENETESGTTTQLSTNTYKSNGAIKTNEVDCWYFWLIHYEYDGDQITTTITYLGSLCGLCEANGIRPGGAIQRIKVMCGGDGGSSDPYTGTENVTIIDTESDNTAFTENGETPDAGSASIIFWPGIRYVHGYDLNVGYDIYGIPIRIISVEVYPATVENTQTDILDTDGHPCRRNVTLFSSLKGGNPIVGPTALVWWDYWVHADYYHNGVPFPSRNWQRSLTKMVTP